MVAQNRQSGHRKSETAENLEKVDEMVPSTPHRLM
jgi:hypothetical protein